MLTFLLTGRPAGREGAASMQSGKCFLYAEAKQQLILIRLELTKLGLRFKLEKTEVYFPDKKKRALGRCEKAETAARAKASEMDVMRTKQKST